MHEVLVWLRAQAHMARAQRQRTRPDGTRPVATMEALAFDADPDEYRRAFLFEGVSWRNQYTRVAHGELTREQIRQDAAWKTWRDGARPAVRRARREPAHAAPPPPQREHARNAGRSADAVVDKPPRDPRWTWRPATSSHSASGTSAAVATG